MCTILWARHPHADRPLIDYEVSTLMQAGELLGVTLGVLLNLLLPAAVISLFLILLLSFNAYKTLAKGREKYRSETAAFAKAARAAELHAFDINGASSSSGSSGGDSSVELASPLAASATLHDLQKLHQHRLLQLAAGKAALEHFLRVDAGLDASVVEALHSFGVDSLAGNESSLRRQTACLSLSLAATLLCRKKCVSRALFGLRSVYSLFVARSRGR
jgi:hypothetical protein